MLRALTIRSVVLIDHLSLDFAAGLSVLTGETGAGKSILLDSLGLAMGARADIGLVQTGAEQATVTAEFEVAMDHAAVCVAIENGLDIEGPLLLRRQLKADGGSRAFINDQPVSVALLRDVGAALIELHGQHDERGLLNPRGHRDLLDSFAGNNALCAAVRTAWRAWQQAKANLAEAETAAEAARHNTDYLSHAVAELQTLKPQPGEEMMLADKRQILIRSEKATEDIASITDLVSGAEGALAQLRLAARKLERNADIDAGLGLALAALDRAVNDTSTAEDALLLARTRMAAEPGQLENMETRLFELRAVARKHKVPVDGLAALASEMEKSLAAAAHGEAVCKALVETVRMARTAYVTITDELSAARRKAMTKLDKAVASELKPLKLDKAQFRTTLILLAETQWGDGGKEQIGFEISTNPGAAFGALNKIASGGELSRFVLALKVALATQGSAGTLIFDEIDRGVGGAVASAIGERLSRLAASAQVLVVTHSPQVAAAGDHHLLISKAVKGKQMRTEVAMLNDTARREEIARMLSGDSVTDEARAQAGRLLDVE